MSNSETCIELLSEVIESFRLGREGQGSHALTQVIDFIMPRMEQYSADLTQDDIKLMNDIITAQERCDFLYVADILEYSFAGTTLGKITGTSPT